MRISIIILLILCVSNSSYSQYRDKAVFDSILHIKKIEFFNTPYSCIYFYDLKQDVMIDTLNTIKSTTYINNALYQYADIEKIELNSEKAANQIRNYVNASKNILNLEKDKTIDSSFFYKTVKHINSDYIAFIFQEGGYFSKKIINKRKTISVITQIASLNRVIMPTEESSSNIYLLIIDIKTRKLIYKDINTRTGYNNQRPYENIAIKNQIKELIETLQHHIKFNIKDHERKLRKLERKRKRRF